MLGLQHDVNRLVAYDPDWPLAYAQEAAALRQALGARLRGLEHYGSTSVPGLCAKPILDILLGVAPLGDWAACRAPLERLGYDYVADAGIEGHYIFGRGRDAGERTHLLHIVAFGEAEWDLNLAMRDALRRDPELCIAYAAEKARAAAAAPTGRAAYNALKGPFILAVRERLRQPHPGAMPG
jgi:GrpB-like predicted nucleotidyltransferase (UPF0157 family)